MRSVYTIIRLRYTVTLSGLKFSTKKEKIKETHSWTTHDAQFGSEAFFLSISEASHLDVCELLLPVMFDLIKCGQLQVYIARFSI